MRGGAGLTLCRWKYRPTEGRFRFAKAARVVSEAKPQKRKGRTARIFLAPPRHNKTTLLHTANDASRQTRRIAYRRECDNRTKNTPSTHHQRRRPETTGGRIAANAAGQLIERVVRLFIANAEWGGWDGLHTKQAWAAPLPAGPLCQSGFDIL